MQTASFDLTDITEPHNSSWLGCPNEITDPAKQDRITADMAVHGWIGPPLVIDTCNLQALTGSHRIAAAIAAELDDVPCVSVETLLANHGDCTWEDLLEERGYQPEEAFRFVEDHLPRELADWLGLDWH